MNQHLEIGNMTERKTPGHSNLQLYNKVHVVRPELGAEIDSPVICHAPEIKHDVHHVTISESDSQEALIMLVTITMHVLPAKRKELLQTLDALMHIMPQHHGYYDTSLTINPNNPDVFIFVEVWENQQALERYMQSEYFSVLQGALKLLTRSSEMTISPKVVLAPKQAQRDNLCQHLQASDQAHFAALPPPTLSDRPRAAKTAVSAPLPQTQNSFESHVLAHDRTNDVGLLNVAAEPDVAFERY